MKHIWKYEEYPANARRCAEINSKKDLIKMLKKYENDSYVLTRSHLASISKSGSMTSCSQARAHARNSVSCNWDKLQQIKNALEIYENYPGKTKDGNH
jgi:hypothetical protein